MKNDTTGATVDVSWDVDASLVTITFIKADRSTFVSLPLSGEEARDVAAIIANAADVVSPPALASSEGSA